VEYKEFSYAVTVSPPNPITTVGRENYAIRCFFMSNEGLQSISWFINGSSLEALALRDVSQIDDISFGFGTLIFRHLTLEYNHTTVQCRGHQQSGGTHISENVLLLLQGKIIRD
jgi:hypothetical protein